jgi:hypothetical protein
VGLRHLPWLQEDKKRNPAGVAEYLTDCDLCMAKKDKAERQTMGCGYEPQSDHAMPWRHTGRMMSRDEVDTSKPSQLKTPVCLGYACSLPEVVEASIAHACFKSGGLLQFTGGETPSDALIQSVMTIESEADKMLAWIASEASKKK